MESVSLEYAKELALQHFYSTYIEKYVLKTNPEEGLRVKIAIKEDSKPTYIMRFETEVLSPYTLEQIPYASVSKWKDKEKEPLYRFAYIHENKIFIDLLQLEQYSIGYKVKNQGNKAVLQLFLLSPQQYRYAIHNPQTKNKAILVNSKILRNIYEEIEQKTRFKGKIKSQKKLF